MKIADINQQANLISRLAQADSSKKGKSSSSGSASSSASSSIDKVELSDRSREIKKIYEAIEKTPDVRAERVEAIKDSIAKGEYEVKSDEVASKMIDEFLYELSR
jgi:negative regulator of flagellin synthesis FlgM